MKNKNEYEKRCKAIQLYKKGVNFEKVLQLLQRGRGWLSKWLTRYKKDGLSGLKDKNRAPKRIQKKTPERIVKKILSIRAELESHKTRRSAFSGTGPEVIHWELQQRKTQNVPSISTIGRILFKHGKTKKVKDRKNGNNQPYPSLKRERIGDLHQTDIVGPRYLNGPKGVVKVYTFNTIDAAGHTTSISHFSDKQSISLCKHLIDTWRIMGIPKISQVDNEMAAAGGGRYPYSISQVIRLHLLIGSHLVFIPQGEPGRNASIESFNALWQERVLRRHICPTLAAIKRTSVRFLRYYHYEKPHRKLTRKENGTRFPGVLRDNLRDSLSHLPEGFALDKYIDRNNHINLPITKGKVSFIIKVNSDGRIDVNGSTYFIRRKLEGQYVIATIFTHRKSLVVKQNSRVIKSFSFSRVRLLLLCCHIQREKNNLVHDVMSTRCIRNQFTML